MTKEEIEQKAVDKIQAEVAKRIDIANTMREAYQHTNVTWNALYDELLSLLKFIKNVNYEKESKKNE